MTMAKKLPLLAPSIHTFEVNGTYTDCEAKRTVFCFDVSYLSVDALFCRRDAAIAIDVHCAPFWLKDNERLF